MNTRGGPPLKTIILALFVIGGIYFIYLYNGCQTRMRELEMTAERYRRDEESKVAQLQELMKSKESQQEKYDTDRQEFVNRLNSLNQQHKMLKSQNAELEADYGRLQQQMQKMKDDHNNLESQRNQEFQQMKQEKELEITTLKDQLANQQRLNANIQNELSSLRSQLQNGQKQLQYDQTIIRDLEMQIYRYKQNAAVVAAQNANAQQNMQQQGQQAQVQAQEQGQQQEMHQPQQIVNQQNVGGGALHDLNANAGGAQHGEKVVNMNQGEQVPGHGNQVPGVNVPEIGGHHNLDQQQQQQLNAQHQVQPPVLDPAQVGGNQGQNVFKRGADHPDLAENQHAQILKPDFNNVRDLNLKKHFAERDFEADDKHQQDNHDNRIQHEGPVGLQVQEPALNQKQDDDNPDDDNLDDDKQNIDSQNHNGENNHFGQRVAPAIDQSDQHLAQGLDDQQVHMPPANDLDQGVKDDIQPLQGQGQGDQIMLPNNKADDQHHAKKDRGVHVEGQGIKHGPVPQEI